MVNNIKSDWEQVEKNIKYWEKIARQNETPEERMVAHFRDLLRSFHVQCNEIDALEKERDKAASRIRSWVADPINAGILQRHGGAVFHGDADDADKIEFENYVVALDRQHGKLSVKKHH